MTHEAQSLHLRYGLDIALSTLNSSRYLNEPKTRFPVGRLFPLPGRELHPLKAPGLSWRTEEASKVRVVHDTLTIAVERPARVFVCLLSPLSKSTAISLHA